MNSLFANMVLEALFSNPKTASYGVAAMILERNSSDEVKAKALEHLSSYESSISPRIVRLVGEAPELAARH